MRITINNSTLELVPPLTLEALLIKFCDGSSGTAVALNQTIIPRQHWPEYHINDGDDILFFQAVTGG